MVFSIIYINYEGVVNYSDSIHPKLEIGNMIKFIETDKRQYDIMRDGTKVVSLDLIFSPITNKFDKLIEFIEDCSVKFGVAFDDWYCGMISRYIESNYDYQIIRENVPMLKSWCDQYIVASGVNFEDYINRAKVSKNSIFFDAQDIEKIIKVANYLKIYFVFSSDSNLKLSQKFHKEVYNDLVAPISSTNIVFKLYKIVASKTYEYNHTDKYMWEYIKAIHCKTTDMHIISIFNFIMNNIMVTCHTTQNPIPYLISVIDESIKWILKNIYKDAVVYSDTISTQDVYTVQGKDNLRTYAHNDTIGKLLIATYNRIEKAGINDIESFKRIISSLKEQSLFANYVTYPILSKVLDIPYRHFTTIPVSNAYLLNVFLYTYLDDDFRVKYPTISSMLLFYNTERPIAKTTYKIKNLPTFFENVGTFLSFKNNMASYDLFSSIIGKMTRNSYLSLVSEGQSKNLTIAKAETDIIHFFSDYFDNRLDGVYQKLQDDIDRIL